MTRRIGHPREACGAVWLGSRRGPGGGKRWLPYPGGGGTTGARTKSSHGRNNPPPQNRARARTRTWTRKMQTLCKPIEPWYKIRGLEGSPHPPPEKQAKGKRSKPTSTPSDAREKHATKNHRHNKATATTYYRKQDGACKRADRGHGPAAQRLHCQVQGNPYHAMQHKSKQRASANPGATQRRKKSAPSEKEPKSEREEGTAQGHTKKTCVRKTRASKKSNNPCARRNLFHAHTPPAAASAAWP